MKKLISYLLTLSASLLLLFSCAGGEVGSTTTLPAHSDPATTTTTSNTTTEKMPDTNEPLTRPITKPSAADTLLSLMQEKGCPADKLPTVERELTAEELSAVSAFLSDEDALTVLGAESFLSPEEIRVYGILYAQIGKEAPEDEKAAVVAKYGDNEWLADDCTKMTTAELDALLRKYTGIGMNPSMKGNYVFYMEEYDAYYMFATDGYGVSMDTLTGYLTTDGDFLIRFGDEYDDRVALLDSTDNGLLIRMMIELKGGLSAN